MPASQINSLSKMDALEIEDDLHEAIRDAGPGGLSFKDGVDLLGIEENRFRLLVSQLLLLQRVKIERGQAGNENRILLPQQVPPRYATITAKQREVLDFLVSQMDDEGLACASFGRIARHTSCRCPSFTIERLDYKGFLEVVDRGTHEANLYRVYPEQDGPRGYSPMRRSQ